MFRPIENDILEYLNSNIGVKAIKLNNTGVYDPTKKIFRKSHNKFVINGIADVLVMVEKSNMCFYFWIEVKSQIGRQGTDQIAFQKMIEFMGGNYYLCRSIQDADMALKDFKNKVGNHWLPF